MRGDKYLNSAEEFFYLCDGVSIRGVNYQAAIDGKLKAQNYVVTVGYRGYGGWMYGGSGTTISAYDEGTLVVDLLDAKTNELIFKGIAKVDMKEMVDNKVEMLDYILTEMFASFPPDNK